MGYSVGWTLNGHRNVDSVSHSMLRLRVGRRGNRVVKKFTNFLTMGRYFEFNCRKVPRLRKLVPFHEELLLHNPVGERNGRGHCMHGRQFAFHFVRLSAHPSRVALFFPDVYNSRTDSFALNKRVHYNAPTRLGSLILQV